MAIYRFKISFEDYTDVIREIDISSKQNFEELHRAIHQATAYDPEKSSSFYISNDQWIKKEEIAYLPNERKIAQAIASMGRTKLSQCIDDPHQKFYYIYNFDQPIDFYVELIKIILDDEPARQYPCVTRSFGQIPKLIAASFLAKAPDISEEFDFLNQISFNTNNAEEIEAMHEIGINTGEDDEQDGEDEAVDEFSNNEDDDADLEKDHY